MDQANLSENKRKVYLSFLPGFHEDQRNNEWWGKGFTDWDNVKSANAKEISRNQPRIPKWGYYSTLESDYWEKIESLISNEYFTGLQFYDYWYGSERLLFKPLDFLLRSDFKVPFFICWANHSWTRSWTNRKGAFDELIKPDYSYPNEHADFLIELFSDVRYVRINGRPILQVYAISRESHQYLLVLKELIYTKSGMEVELWYTLKDMSNMSSDLFSKNRQIYFQP